MKKLILLLLFFIPACTPSEKPENVDFVKEIVYKFIHKETCNTCKSECKVVSYKPETGGTNGQGVYQVVCSSGNSYTVYVGSDGSIHPIKN